MRAKHLASFFLCAAVGCNAILNNDKRSLASPIETQDAAIDGAPIITPPPPPPDATTPEAGTSAPAPEAGPTIPEEAGPTPMSCPSPDGSAECVPGKVQMEQRPCGDCMRGSETRMRVCGDTCGWGAWTVWSGCQLAPDVCPANKVQERTESCGPCMTGMKVSKRTCSASCVWGEWSAGACEIGPEHCMPGDTKNLEDLRCGTHCGVSKRTQTCLESCTWGATVTGLCMEQGVCVPDQTQPAGTVNCNPSYCSKGVQNQVRRCTDSCTWSDPIPEGACTIPENVCRPADQGGTGYRCLQNESGVRQLCNPSTANQAQRCTWGQREQFAGCQR